MIKIRITQIKSTINQSKRQKDTIKALKLGKINKSVEIEKTPQIEGMIRKINHLVTTQVL